MSDVAISSDNSQEYAQPRKMRELFKFKQLGSRKESIIQYICFKIVVITVL
jgi:hypothetical protein